MEPFPFKSSTNAADDEAALERALSYLKSTRETHSLLAVDEIAARASKMLHHRTLRSQTFAGLEHLLANPGWGMLLTLYVALASRGRVTVTSLAKAIDAPQTTTLRYIASFARAGMISREPDIHDRRRVFLSLTERGQRAMEEFLSMAE